MHICTESFAVFILLYLNLYIIKFKFFLRYLLNMNIDQICVGITLLLHTLALHHSSATKGYRVFYYLFHSSRQFFLSLPRYSFSAILKCTRKKDVGT